MKSSRLSPAALYLIVFLLVSSCAIFTNRHTVLLPKGTFSADETALITGRDTAEPMRVFKTDSKSDSILLRSKSSDVDPVADSAILKKLIRGMYLTITDSASLGVGIAAPQVGVLKNVILVERSDKKGSPFETYLNPKIIQYSKMKQDCREGCLSVPVTRGVTKNRSYSILVEYTGFDNKPVREMVEGFTAVIFQHEIDHLNGILFFDHI
ncbi:MAG: peptide deformylase [Bacteroidetes bacterium GWF2_41_61]|nr:MAG: peptide deformylase [Bacteroidetes bacterium GWF2_41_61]OFY88742.1 MAG: peptide deformylase [Bacteroidetes bacterium RIFOXYA12_FULL_40_10]HBG25272.1 peptide deformylase [Rikenellaceae bacterium]